MDKELEALKERLDRLEQNVMNYFLYQETYKEQQDKKINDLDNAISQIYHSSNV